MPIDVGKIVLLALILVGFFGLMYMLKTKLNKNCTDGDVYDDKLGKCIKDCSVIPGTRYDSDKDQCIQNCPGNTTLCGTNCFDDTLQTCFNSNFVCNIGQQLCPADGSGTSPVCYNPDNEQCIGGVVYTNAKACSATLGCGPDTQCSNDNTQCISCPDTSGYCKGSNTCCPAGHVCSSDGKTCTICAGGTQSCGNACYTSATQICCPDNKTICNSNQTCCSGNCCDAGTTCVNGACCTNQNVYTINGQKTCCPVSLCDDGSCCTGQDNQGNKRQCHNGKCMIQCMNDPSQSLFCDPSNNDLCIDATDNNGNLRVYCGHDGCGFGDLSYNPTLVDKSNKSIPAFISGTGKLYISNPLGVQGLNRDVSSNMPKTSCTVNDCTGRLQEHGLESETVNLTNGVCKGSFDPSIINPTPQNPTICPFSDTSRCCTDVNNQLTGQVCNVGKTCHHDNCYDKLYKCKTDGTCVMYGTDMWDDPSGTTRYSASDNICSNQCIPAIKTQTSNVGEEWGHDMGQGRCTNYALNMLPKQDSNYTWACSPNGTSSTNIMYTVIGCTCTGYAKDCTVYTDADRKQLPPGHPCWKCYGNDGLPCPMFGTSNSSIADKPNADTNEATYIAYANTWGITSGIQNGVVPTTGAGNPYVKDWSDQNSVLSCLNYCTQDSNCTGVQVLTTKSNTIQSNPLNENKILAASSINIGTDPNKKGGICYTTYNTGPVTSTNTNTNTANSAWTLYAKKM